MSIHDLRRQSGWGYQIFYKLEGVGLFDNNLPSTRSKALLKKILIIIINNFSCDTWRKTRDIWHMTHDMWHMKLTCDTWNVTHDTLHVTHDKWWEVKILSKCPVPRLYGLGLNVFWRYFHKRISLINELMSKVGVNRAALATPGLLNIMGLINNSSFIREILKKWKEKKLKYVFQCLTFYWNGLCPMYLGKGRVCFTNTPSSS